VHRDVSPQNILVGVDGSGRITDFGVARASSRLSATRSGQLKGKLAYMAPEQARGGDIDRRADVFAMAIVLWEALTGRRLFKAENEMATLNRVLFEPIPGPRTIEPSIPEVIEAVVMKALDRDPNARFESAAEFADAIENAAAGVVRMSSVRDVAGYVQKILGEDLGLHRDAVRTWLTSGDGGQQAPLSGPFTTSQSYPRLTPNQQRPSAAPQSVTGAAGVMSLPENRERSQSPAQSERRGGRSSRRLIAFAVAFLVSVTAGFAIFFVLSGKRDAATASNGVASSASVAPAVATSAAATVATPAVDNVPTAAASAAAPPSNVGVNSLPDAEPAKPVAGTSRPSGGSGKSAGSKKPEGAAPSGEEKYVNPYRLALPRQESVEHRVHCPWLLDVRCVSGVWNHLENCAPYPFDNSVGFVRNRGDIFVAHDHERGHTNVR
jgi:serine/threonine-protein kinase